MFPVYFHTIADYLSKMNIKPFLSEIAASFFGIFNRNPASSEALNYLQLLHDKFQELKAAQKVILMSSPKP